MNPGLKIYEKFPKIFRNRYLLTLIIFTIWMLFLDSHNLVGRFRELKNLRDLKKQQEYYTNKIVTEKERLRELKTDNNNLEKFAREQYRMKKPDEDLYIILSPKEERRNARKTN
jgi:cell division protein DivIC